MQTEDAHHSQRASTSFWDEMRQLLRLGLPIAFVQLGMTAMNFVDVALLGRHDEASLPARMVSTCGQRRACADSRLRSAPYHKNGSTPSACSCA